MPSNHLILCHPLLLLPSIFPSIRVFSNESALQIRWAKYWSFNFNISPSNEHSGLFSFRMKRSGERERYTQLNAEFQRIARRDKRDFLNEQCKDIEENSSIGKTRDLFKKIVVIKGTCHSRMGAIKHRNGKDLTEAYKNKKRWQEYTELYKKGFNDLDNHEWGHLPRARYPGVWSQVGLRKHYYEQS